MPTQRLSPAVIEAALLGFEEQKKRIDLQIAELRQLRDGNRPEPNATPEPGKRKRFSAGARRKMAEAQRLRWAKIRGEGEPGQAEEPEPPKAKRQISKEGMARIVAATKKRWAAVRRRLLKQHKWWRRLKCG